MLGILYKAGPAQAFFRFEFSARFFPPEVKQVCVFSVVNWETVLHNNGQVYAKKQLET